MFGCNISLSLCRQRSLILGGSGKISRAMCDLKNPYFRYTMVPPQPPPGTRIAAAVIVCSYLYPIVKIFINSQNVLVKFVILYFSILLQVLTIPIPQSSTGLKVPLLTSPLTHRVTKLSSTLPSCWPLTTPPITCPR